MENVTVTKSYNSEGATISVTEKQGRRSLARLRQDEYTEGRILADVLFYNLPGETVKFLVKHLLQIWPELREYVAGLL